jgi:hypothetical protein
MEKIIKVLRKEKLVSIEKVTTDIWDLFKCLKCYKAIMQREAKTAHIYQSSHAADYIYFKLIF